MFADEFTGIRSGVGSEINVMGTRRGRLPSRPFQSAHVGGDGSHAIPWHGAEGLGGWADREAPDRSGGCAVSVHFVDAPVIGAFGQGAWIEGGCGLISPEFTCSRRWIGSEVNISGNSINSGSPTQIRVERMTHRGIRWLRDAGRAGRKNAAGILDDLESGWADMIEAISPDFQSQ